MPCVSTVMKSGETYNINDQTLVYDNEGIAVKLNPRSIAVFERVVKTHECAKDTDVMGRRYTVRYDDHRAVFVLEVTGGNRVEVPYTNMFPDIAAAA